MIAGQRHPASCIVCGRRPEGYGYTPTARHAIAWACTDHLPEARMAYHMPRTKLDAFEQVALREAGDMAGAYLDSIGETDLAKLSEEQWLIFRKTMLEEFGESMRRQIDKDGAPF